MVAVRTQTAPALLRSLLQFDPREIASLDRRQSCDHAYYAIVDRSTLPALDERPSITTRWNNVSICQRCRCHVELSITFADATSPCPSSGNPLHFFEFQDPSPEDNERATPLHRFVCAQSGCRAVLHATIRRPVLDPADEVLLTEPSNLKRRYKVAFAQHPSLQEMAPIQSLSTLRSYIKGALADEKTRIIPARNKRFMYALGEDAKDLLVKLGFIYAPGEDEDGMDHWLPPGHEGHVDDNTQEILLDCRDELTLLMQYRSEAEKMTLKEQERKDLYSAPATTRDMERLLGMLDYDKRLSLRPTNQAENIACMELGCLANFSDGLIAYAYDTLVKIHPGQAPAMFDRLRAIAAERQSESLQLKATMLESGGQQSREALKRAYYQLGYDFERAETVPDEEILGTYQARIPDVGMEQQNNLKQALKLIADSRNSALLSRACSNQIETYEQALFYFDCTSDTPDDFIITLYATKVADSPAEEDTARAALLLIAKERNSPGLQGYLDQGEVPAPQMDIRDAYQTFGVGSGAHVEDQFIMDAFSINASEAPGRLDHFRKALSVIAHDRNSPSLLSALQDSATQTTQLRAKSAPSEPRGIGNLANTCYMNTLFQWFFYIKPVRDRVLNFEQYKENPSSRLIFKEKVGDMNVGKKEVLRAQRFVQALAVLYKDMITIQDDYPAANGANDQERADYPTPSIELARLTLAPVSRNAARRRSTITGGAGSGRALSSPHLERFPFNRGSEKNGETGQESPSTVAITDSPVDMHLHGFMAEKQPHPVGIQASKPTLTPESSGEATSAFPATVPNAGTPNGINVTEGAVSVASGTGSASTDHSGPEAIEIAPPVPPRPRLESVDDLASMEQLATQQDVSEAIENMLHQFSWAWKPSVNGSHQPVDIVSKLFYGKESMVTWIRDKPTDTEYRRIVTSETFYNIFVPLSKESEQENIYSALGNALDRNVLTDSAGYNYRTLKELPEILQFRVHRVDYDKNLGRPVKNKIPLKLDEEIYMDRYVDDEAMLAKRKTSWDMKDQLESLRKHRALLTETAVNSTIPEAMSNLKSYLGTLGQSAEELGLTDLALNGDLAKQLDANAAATQQEIDETDAKISNLEVELEGLFEKGGKLKYRLHSVFVHTGDQTGSGHWYVYILDPSTGIWRWFNDGQVLEVKDVHDIFSPKKDAHGHSTLIAYVRADRQDEIMDTVRREYPDNVEASGPPSQTINDVAMQEGS